MIGVGKACDDRLAIAGANDAADAARFLVTLKERVEGGNFESNLGL